MTATRARDVQALLDDLAEHPRDAAYDIFEFAHELHLAGDDESALHCLLPLAELSGLDGSLARVQIAELYFEAGRDEEALAQLDMIESAHEREPMAYSAAAELLLHHGDDDAALRWYTMGALRLTEQQRAAARGEGGWLASYYPLLWQRHLLRQRLGLEQDDFEDGLWEPPLRRRSFRPTSEVLDDPRVSRAKTMRILVWPEPDFVAAKRRWPDALDGTFDDYRTRLESQYRELSRRSRGKLVIVHGRFDRMREWARRTGGDMEDEQVRLGHMEQQFARGEVVAWPPGRNAACWCGSNAKYKKCCGRPG